MVASRSTAEQVLEVLRRHLTQETMVAVLGDLRDVRGNRSFTDTINMLYERVRPRQLVDGDELRKHVTRMAGAAERLKAHIDNNFPGGYAVGLGKRELIAYSKTVRVQPDRFPTEWEGFRVAWHYMGWVRAT